MAETNTSKILSSDRHLAASIGKNTIFGVVNSAVWAATRLITVPIVVYHLGLSGYGIWSIIMTSAAYMRFGAAGIKSAFQKYVAEATGTGNFEKANELVSTGSISMLGLSALGLIPVAIFSRKVAQAAGVPPEFISAAAASLTVLAFTYLISNFGAAFEAIVMGGHRIDLTRKFNTILTVCEAVAVIVVLHLGYGLVAMTIVMAASELFYIFACYVVSHQIVPRMKIGFAHFRNHAFPELLRFAGSYQLVNVLELSYSAIWPIVLLRCFGPEANGIAALAGRVVTSCLIAQDALLLPILSGGTMVFASGTVERVKLFLAKSFKITVMVSLPPLAFVSAFGALIVQAWTGETRSAFSAAIALTALASFLKALSLLQLILYRSSGKALLDNIRQVLRIITTLVIAAVARKIGFLGVLAGMSVAELVGVIFMFFAMAKTFHGFSTRMLVGDVLRITTATAAIVGCGALAGLIPVPFNLTARLGAAVRLCEIAVASAAVAWPALTLTGSISGAEKRTFLDSLIPGRRVLTAD